jgi:hypothetical protein
MSPAPSHSGPLEVFFAWWAREDARRVRVLAWSLALICAAVAILGVPRLRLYGNDVFVPLDGAWRILNGQRPAVDFFAQLGPGFYLLNAVGLWLAGNDARGLGYAKALATAGLALWAFLLLRRRMKIAPLWSACVFIVLLAGAPFSLGTHPWQSTFAMTYNRYGFALASLVLLESFLPADDAAFWGAFSSGVACALALFMKVSYGFVGLGFAAVSLAFHPKIRLRVAGIAAGLAAVGLPMMAWLRFDFAALVREYRTLAMVKSEQAGLEKLAQFLYYNRLEIALAAMLALLAALLPGVPTRRRIALILAAGMGSAASTLLLITNAQAYGLPLLTCSLLLVVEEATAGGRAAPGHAAAVIAVALVAVGIPIGMDAAGLAAALEDKVVRGKPSHRISARHLASLEFVDCPPDWQGSGCGAPENGQFLVRSIEDGISLIEANAREGEAVRGMTMTETFSYATLRKPARGGAVVIGGSVAEDLVPSKEWLVGDAALLLVPRYDFSAIPGPLANVVHRYPELLSEDFVPVAESTDWTLYRRVK